MKFATLDEGGPDGILLVVSGDLGHAVRADDIVPSLREALESWDRCHEALVERSRALAEGRVRARVFPLESLRLRACLPRAFQFVDGSAYLAHVERVRRARGAEMPPSFLTDPLMYQAVSDAFLAPRDPIQAFDEAHGIDFEAEVGVITAAVPAGADRATARAAVRLVTILNDVSLRELIPAELAKGFGFLQSKPLSALAPVAVTPDELAPHWRDDRLHRPLVSRVNGETIGEPDAGVDMQFGFDELIVHAARTRPLGPGTLVGSGTVANRDERRGCSCLAERRVLELLNEGRVRTPFLRFGDRVRIEMTDEEGRSIFGVIEQKVVRAVPPAP
jgi:fumarylacetoacetate (FAA) hydrolase